MTRLIAIVVIGAIAWQGWDAYQARASGGDLYAASELLDLETATDPRNSPYSATGARTARR